MGRIIAITSGKGGVGKSSVAVGLSVALGRMENRVLLVDLDAGMRCLDIHLNLSDKLVFDLNDLLSGEKDLQSVLLKNEIYPNLSLIAAPLNSTIEHNALRAFLNTAADDFDFIILDFPAGGVNTLYDALPRFAEGLVVSNADAVSVRDAQTVGRDLAENGLMSVRLVLNRVDFSYIKKGILPDIDAVIDRCGLRLMAIIPSSTEMYYSACTGKPLNKSCKAYKAFERLAQRIMGYNIPLPPCKKIQ